MFASGPDNLPDILPSKPTTSFIISANSFMEVPTPVEGVIKKINVDIGDKVSAGNIFLEVETVASSLPIPDKEITPPKVEVPAESDAHKNTDATSSEAQPVTQSKFNVYAGPAVRKLAREFGINEAVR